MVIYFTAEPKICNFKFPIMQKNILWFNVSVDDVAVIEDLIARTEVSEKPPNELL